MSKNIYKLFVITLFSMLISSTVFAKDKVVYSGFAFLTDAENIAEQFPYTCRLVSLGACGKNRAEKNIVDEHLYNAVKASSNPNLEFIAFQQGLQVGTAAALAMDRESVKITKFTGGYSIIIDLSAQIIVFDFAEKNIVATYPIAIRYSDFHAEKPSDAYLSGLIKSMMVDESFPVNLIDEFSYVLNKLKLNEARLYLQVRQIDLADNVISYLQKNNVSERAYKTWLAQLFSAALSSEQKLPILPYTTGDAIGRSMPARFSDASVYNFQLSDPDFVVDVRVRGLIKTELDKTSERIALAYKSGLAVTFSGAGSGKKYFEHKYTYGRTKEVSTRQEMNDWEEFTESMMSLVTMIARSFTERDKKWVQAYVKGKVKTRTVLKDMEVLEKKVFQKVR